MKTPTLKMTGVMNLPISSIDPNPAQPRQNFNVESIGDLASSISQIGLLTPISVRRDGSRYQLIAGERRLMAFRLLGERFIPAIVLEVNDTDSAVLALVENLQRNDLDFLEEAAAMASLMQNEGLTQRQLAQRLGLASSTVSNKLRLLRLPPNVLLALQEAGMTERHARALLPLCNDPKIHTAAQRVISQRLSVAKTEELVSHLMSPKKGKGRRVVVLKDLRIFTSTINRAVDVMKQAGLSVTSLKSEDADSITYTVVVKKPDDHRKAQPFVPAKAR